MDRQYDQVHELPAGYVATDYTYDGLIPWIDLGKIAIYLLTFMAAFMMFRTLFRLL